MSDTTASDTYIFLDTCSLLVSSWTRQKDDSFLFDAGKDRRFWQSEIRSLINAGTVILTKRNYEELIKLSKVHNDPRRPDLAERCAIVLERVHELILNKELLIVGDANDPFADAILLSVALKFRTTKNLLFLTQDRALATDLIAIANFKSVQSRKGHELKVRRIGKTGAIERWHLNANYHFENQARPCNPRPIIPSKPKRNNLLGRWWRS